MTPFVKVLIAVTWLASLMWAIVGIGMLDHWHNVNHCGKTGIYVIGKDGSGYIGGGCNILDPGLYRITKITALP